jgi:two-component system, response regulator, stage 0 sporulation protein F
MTDKIKLLYVDDEPLNLLVFERVFSKNFEVITSLSGTEGLEKLHSNSKIRVVISDMKMPQMNGIEFISQAKKIFPEIAYFILTGYEITEEIAFALNNKLIVKYFRKPFNVKEIETAIEETLK